jgi:hypothetical protein
MLKCYRLLVESNQFLDKMVNYYQENNNNKKSKICLRKIEKLIWLDKEKLKRERESLKRKKDNKKRNTEDSKNSYKETIHLVSLNWINYSEIEIGLPKNLVV